MQSAAFAGAGLHDAMETLPDKHLSLIGVAHQRLRNGDRQDGGLHPPYADAP